REDQEHTSALLRAGAVMAAVTDQAAPVPGCTVTRLGGMRYRPMAAPGFAARWFPDGPTREALRRAPVVVFDRHDDLQHRYLRARGVRDIPPAHYVPASADLLAAIILGFGWGMVAWRKARSPAVAAASVRPSAGIEYIRRAHRGRLANESAASPPQAGWAGVRKRTQPGIGGSRTSRAASRAAGVVASSGRCRS